MRTRFVSIALTTLLAATMAGCAAEDARQKSADTTQQVKEESREAAAKTKEGLKQAGKDIKAAAEGAKEGWTEDKNAIDLNSATEKQLTAIGLGAKQAQLVIENRPYKARHELVTKGVLSEQEYKEIETKVAVK